VNSGSLFRHRSPAATAVLSVPTFALTSVFSKGGISITGALGRDDWVALLLVAVGGNIKPAPIGLELGGGVGGHWVRFCNSPVLRRGACVSGKSYRILLLGLASAYHVFQKK
jgi:hypothetical protein